MTSMEQPRHGRMTGDAGSTPNPLQPQVGATPTGSAEPGSSGQLTRHAIGFRVFSSASTPPGRGGPPMASCWRCDPGWRRPVVLRTGTHRHRHRRHRPRRRATRPRGVVLGGRLRPAHHLVLRACSSCPCSHGRKRLFLYEVLAVGSGWVRDPRRHRSGTDPSTSLSGLINSTSPPIYLATRIAIATAVIVTASPDLARPLRLIGRWLIAIGMVSGIALGAALPIGVAAGFLIGLGSAALVHLLFGSPGGRLTLDQVTEVLRELGVDATATEDAPLQPRGVAAHPRLHAGGSPAPGQDLRPRRPGRPARGRHLVRDLAPGRETGPAGRLEQVEHEAFLTLAAERGGVPVMPAIAAGETDQGDALLVLDADGRPSARWMRTRSPPISCAAPGVPWEASTSSASRTDAWTRRVSSCGPTVRRRSPTSALRRSPHPRVR